MAPSVMKLFALQKQRQDFQKKAVGEALENTGMVFTNALPKRVLPHQGGQAILRQIAGHRLLQDRRNGLKILAVNLMC